MAREGRGEERPAQAAAVPVTAAGTPAGGEVGELAHPLSLGEAPVRPGCARRGRGYIEEL